MAISAAAMLSCASIDSRGWCRSAVPVGVVLDIWKLLLDVPQLVVGIDHELHLRESDVPTFCALAAVALETPPQSPCQAGHVPAFVTLAFFFWQLVTLP